MRPLPTDAEPLSDRGEGPRWLSIQTGVPDHHLLERRRQLPDERPDRALDLGPLDPLDRRAGRIDQLDRPPPGPTHRDRPHPRPGDRRPDRPPNGRDRVGTEAGPAARVIPDQGSPQPEPALVQGVGERQLPQPLLAHHPAHQPLVPRQLLSRARLIS